MFDDGAHDRLFTGMLSGAALVSDYSRYGAEIFQDGEDLCFFRWDEINKLPEMLYHLLIDEEARLAMIKKAYEKAITQHTWKARLQRIVQLVEMYKTFEMRKKKTNPAPEKQRAE